LHQHHISSSGESFGPDIAQSGTRPCSPAEQDLSDILENYIQRHPDSDQPDGSNDSQISFPPIATSSLTGLLEALSSRGDSPSGSSQAKAHIVPQSAWLQLQLSSDDSLNTPLNPRGTRSWCSTILSSSEEENLGSPVIFQSGIRNNLTPEQDLSDILEDYIQRHQSSPADKSSSCNSDDISSSDAYQPDGYHLAPSISDPVENLASSEIDNDTLKYSGK